MLKNSDNYVDMKRSDELSIYLPASAGSGRHYTQANLSDGFDVDYTDENEKFFHVYSSQGFDLYVDEWNGIGGMARGRFSGKLKGDTDNVTITDGVFESLIKGEL